MGQELLHIVSRSAWDAARRAGRYAPPSLAAEGFIHLSTPSQLDGTARRYYAGQQDLVLLVLDESAFEAGALRWEVPTSGDRQEPFPHLHRALDPAEVREVRDFAAPA